jgi:hypothetical protein
MHEERGGPTASLSVYVDFNFVSFLRNVCGSAPPSGESLVALDCIAGDAALSTLH